MQFPGTGFCLQHLKNSNSLVYTILFSSKIRSDSFISGGLYIKRDTEKKIGGKQCKSENNILWGFFCVCDCSPIEFNDIVNMHVRKTGHGTEARHIICRAVETGK